MGIESVKEEELEQLVEGEPFIRELSEETADTISQDVMSTHAGQDDLCNKYIALHVQPKEGTDTQVLKNSLRIAIFDRHMF